MSTSVDEIATQEGAPEPSSAENDGDRPETDPPAAEGANAADAVAEEEEFEEEIIEDEEEEFFDEEEIVDSEGSFDEEEVVESDEEGMETTVATPIQPEVTEEPQPDAADFTNFADFPTMEDENNTNEEPSQLAYATGGIASNEESNYDEEQPFNSGAQFEVPHNESEEPIPIPRGPVRDEEDEKFMSDASPLWYWLVCFLVLCLLGAGGFVGWYLVSEDASDTPNLGDDNVTLAPTAAPTVAVTTEFAPVLGICQLSGVENPHPIDQCLCNGEISIIADDIRGRYNNHLKVFIPTIYSGFSDEITSCTARNQALVWLSSGNDFSFTVEERTERFALATLYAGLAGADWEMAEQWLSGASICDWQGVTCTDEGFLQILNLSDKNLVGTLLPEIALLTNMVQLFAARNQIVGAIPNGLFDIPNLQIADFSFNGLSGPLPPSIGNAKELTQLNVEQNSFEGRITQSLADATNLQVLNLASNSFVGSLPSRLFSMKELLRLNIGGNELTGSIPSQLSMLSSLTSLTLGPNNFVGGLPESISTLVNLTSLVIRDVPQLTGRLPAVYAQNLKSLVELTIVDTGISGNIESVFGELPLLQRLDLSRNQFRGTIPTQLGNLGNLTIMDLGNNFLGGAIPAPLGNLGNLTRMSLNDNVLVGGVPANLGALEKLQFLRLDGNTLTGRVSAEVCGLRNANLSSLIVDCPFTQNGVSVGVICEIPSCCTGCRTSF